MDGTLLQNGAQSISEETIALIRRILQKGILFVPASGRQYPNLRNLFAGVEDQLSYVCENGSLVVHRDEVLFSGVIERALGERILEAIRRRSGSELVLSGVHTSYVQPKEQAFYRHLCDVVKNDVTVVDDILDIKEPYLKISVYEKEGIDNSSVYWKETFGGEVTVVTSGNLWLDMIPLQVNKASAIEVLMKKFAISPDEVVAFGDHFNDVEMLELAGYPVAMDNAQPEIKAMCRYHTDTVEHMLEKILAGGEI